MLDPGTPTGIGSLPFDDPRVACDVELRLHPELPAAPQLPRVSVCESMVAQIASGMRGVKVCHDGSIEVDRRRLAPAQEGDGLCFESWCGTLTFLDTIAKRRGPAKVQLTGPLTLGLALMDSGVRAARAFSIASATVRAQVTDLLALMRVRCPEVLPVVVLDEPSLVGTTGDDFPLPPEETIDILSGGLASATSAGAAVAGIHACGPVDWSLALHAGPDLISVPASPEVAVDSPSISVFLDRGGWIAWGVVPTDRPLSGRDTPYWRRLHETWAALAASGCDPVRLRTQALVTPACGLATHDVGQVPAIMGLVRRVAERVQDQALAVRMSAGA